jgi:D-lactate dehydrogenase
MSTKITFFSSKPYDEEFFKKENISTYESKYTLRFLENQLNADTVKLLAGDDSTIVCVFVNDIVNREVITSLSEYGIKMIALRCAGFNNVDLIAAKEYNITVSRVPAYSPEAVAEHTIALILTLNRKIHKAYQRTRDQNYSLNGLLGFNLYKKTIGVIGTGRIGQAFIKIMVGFGCNIVAYDVFPCESLKELGEDGQVTLVNNLDQIYEQSDIISLHCPLIPHQNKYIINDDSINKMKDGVIIINTSRGGLICTTDVIKNLKSRKIGGLAIDVYEQEEHLFFKDLSGTIIQDDIIQRLTSFPNVIVTAHQAFFTEEALTQISAVTMKSINDLIETGSVCNNCGL